MSSPLMTPDEAADVYDGCIDASFDECVHAIAKAQHARTIAAIEAIPVETLYWSEREIANAVRAAIVAALRGEAGI